MRWRHRLGFQTCAFPENQFSKSRKFCMNQSFQDYPKVDITERFDAADIHSESIRTFGICINWDESKT